MPRARCCVTCWSWSAGIGIGVTWLALTVERSRFFAVARSHEPLLPFAIGLVVFALAELIHANAFLAAFGAGVTFSTMRPHTSENFHAFFEQVSELLKLAALLVFAVLISPQFLREIPLSGYVFALLALLVTRPAALGLAMVGADLGWREKLAAMWFGPKGFASVVYGIMVFNSGVEGANESFHLIALVVTGSIVAHSSTDVTMARWLNCKET